MARWTLVVCLGCC